MSFLSVLGKIGQAAFKGFQIAEGIEPIAVKFLPPSVGQKVDDTFNNIADSVMVTEAVIGAISDPAARTGSLKLKAATPLVATAIQQYIKDKFPSKKIKDEAKFTAAVTGIASNVADLLNSLGD